MLLEAKLGRKVSIPEVFQSMNYDQKANRWLTEESKSVYREFLKLKKQASNQLMTQFFSKRQLEEHLEMEEFMGLVLKLTNIHMVLDLGVRTRLANPTRLGMMI